MKKNKNIFADIKNMTTFVVQNRGVEQLVARRAHNPEAGGSSPSPATKQDSPSGLSFFYRLTNPSQCQAVIKQRQRRKIRPLSPCAGEGTRTHTPHGTRS